MTYKVHVSGQPEPTVFDRLSSADAYRHQMAQAGFFAWVSSS